MYLEDEPLSEAEEGLRANCQRFPPPPHPDAPYRGLAIYPLTSEADGCGEYTPSSEKEFERRCRRAAELLQWEME
jgi:hypothetical protein